MTPCQGHALLFDDPAAVDTARGICKRQCAQLIECRAWALRTDVAGVCGGLTEQERDLWRRDFAGGPTVHVRPRWEPLDRDIQVAITAARRAGFREADIARALGLNVHNLPSQAAYHRSTTGKVLSRSRATSASMSTPREMEVAG